MLRCVVLCALIACVLGHAVMTTPKSLNTNPTTAKPCGVTTYPANPTPAATFRANVDTTLQWLLVAGDGGKLVSGVLDPAGGTNFDTTKGAIQLFTEISIGTTTGKNYPLTFKVPATACSKGACMMRVYSETGWNSCTYINITQCDDCPLPTAAPAVCKQADDLEFCTQFNNANVEVSADSTANAVDDEIAAAYKAALNNSNVFATPKAPGCTDAYKSFLCGLRMPPCPGTGQTFAVGEACHAQCVDTMEKCGLTEIHKALYDCDALPRCIDEDSSAATVAASLLAAVLLVAAML